MKHLRKFNEELSPSTYIDAGKKLARKGHDKRGRDLTEYGRSKSEFPEIEGSFEFFSHGERINAKWDFKKGVFIGDNGKNIYFEGNNLKYNAFPRMKGDQHPKAYLANRKEAIRFTKFLKSANIDSIPRINDLYLDAENEIYKTKNSKNKTEIRKSKLKDKIKDWWKS